MSTPFQAITTGDKSLSERASAPLRAVKSEFKQRREQAEGTYDAMNIDYMGLPENQVQLAQSWGDAVRENLVEGYRTNNQDMIRDAKNQGRQLQSYITTMQNDYAMGRNSMKRAEEKQFRDLSNTREEIEMGFKNRYQAPIGFEADERGYPTGIVIDGERVSVNTFANALKDNPFMVVDAVDFGGGFRAEKNASRHSAEVNALSTAADVRAKAGEFASKDIENDMVSNEDLAVLYAVRNKLIKDVNNPSEQDVLRIQEIANNPAKLEEARGQYVEEYQDYLVNSWTTNEKARRRQESLADERGAKKGMLSLSPVVTDGLSTYYTDVEGVDFNIKGNQTVTSVAFDQEGEIAKVTVRVKEKASSNDEMSVFDSSSGIRYRDVEYIVGDIDSLGENQEPLTQEIRQLVRNRMDAKVNNGFSRMQQRAINEFGSGPNEEAVIDIFSQPAE